MTIATISSTTHSEELKLKAIPHVHYPIEPFDLMLVLKNMQICTHPVANYTKTINDAELNTRIVKNYQNVTAHYLHDGLGKNEPSIIVRALATHLLNDFGAISVRKA